MAAAITAPATNSSLYLKGGMLGPTPRDAAIARGQELCERRGGFPGLPVPNKPEGFCGRKATVKRNESDHPHQAGTPTTSATGWLSRVRVAWRSGSQSGTALSLDGSRILGQRVPRLADTARPVCGLTLCPQAVCGLTLCPQAVCVLTLCPHAVCCADVMSPGCLQC